MGEIGGLQLMSTGASASVRKLLGSDVIADLEKLTQVNSYLGLRDVVVDLAVVVFVVLTVNWLNLLWLYPLAVMYIGVRQRHLSNLGHELTHSKLVVGQRATRWLGNLLMLLLGEPFDPYRRSHARHHSRLGKSGDPMFESYMDGQALEPRSGVLNFFVFVYLRSVLWRLPIETIRRWYERGESEGELSRTARVGCWLVGGFASFALGFGWLFLLLWVLPLVFVRPAVTWLTDLGNHAGVIENKNPLLQTRGWTSDWLTRHLLGGHLDDMYHPVHHLCPKIPWRRLPEAEAILRARVPNWDQVPWCSGFFVRRRVTPDIPSVLEDIMTRTRLNAARATS